MDLTEAEIIKVIGIIGLLHVLLATLSMVELKLIPFYSIVFARRQANGVAHELAREAPFLPSLHTS